MTTEALQAPRKLILLVYFLLGAAAVTWQSILLREFTVLAFGNEIAWGMLLLAWLAGVGIGNSFAGRLRVHPHRALTLLIIFAALAAILSVCAPPTARLARFLFDLTPGQYIPLLHMLWLAFLIAFPVAFVVGTCFPLAALLLERGPNGTAGTTSAYVFESLGSLAGGALFSFFLVCRFHSLAIVSFLGFALIAVLLLLAQARSRRILLSSALLVALGLMLIAGDANLDNYLLHKRWVAMHGTDNLLSSGDSRYQNIELSRLEDQYSLYLDGLIATTFPDPVPFAETTHLAMCEHPAPKDVLILGGGAEGILSHVLLHPVDHVDYVSLDPMVLETIRPRLAPADVRALLDPRVTLHEGDGRLFVKHASRRYDLIIVDAPGPVSAMANRTYTKEFFREAGAILKPKGVLTFGLASSASYMSEDRKRYLASVRQALAQTFPNSFMTWSTHSQVFASATEDVLTIDPVELRKRYDARRIDAPSFQSDWFSAAALDLLDPRKVASLDQAAKDAPPTPANSDWFPAASFYHLVLWDQMTGGRSQAILGALKSVQAHYLWLVALPPLAALAWLVWIRFRRGRALWLQTGAVTWSAATTGFAGLSLELVLLYAFQSLYGYVYERIGLIVALFMFGLAVGALSARRWQRSHPSTPGRLAAFDLVITVILALTPAILMGTASLGNSLPALAEAVVMAEVVLAGLLGGLTFPICLSLYRSGAAGPTKAAAAIASADNIGACAGALLAGVALVPVVGMVVTCILLAWLKLTSVVLLLWCRSREQRATS